VRGDGRREKRGRRVLKDMKDKRVYVVAWSPWLLGII